MHYLASDILNYTIIMPLSNPAYFRIFKSFYIPLFLLILISGCTDSQDQQLYSKDEAETKFLQICQKEYNWDIITSRVGKTLWIYLPYQQDVLRFKANRFPQTYKCQVSYINGEFSGQTFFFEYQITSLHKTEENRGYTNTIADKVREDFQNLLNAIYRVYPNAENQPDFFLIVMSDIANGVDITYIVYNEDLKKMYTNALPLMEYSKRIVQDVSGSTKIIGDKTGRHLNYEDIDFRQFLIKQISQRIRLEFLGTGSKYCLMPEERIINIIAYSVRTYDFEDFSTVVTNNLSTGAKERISKEALREIRIF